MTKYVDETKRTSKNQDQFEEAITRVDSNGMTPLTLAAKLSYRDFSNMLPIIHYLLSVNSSKAFVLKKDLRGLNLFDEAVYAKNNDLLEYLFKKEAKRYFKSIDKRIKVA